MERWYHKYVGFVWNSYVYEAGCVFFGLLIWEKAFFGLAIENQKITKVHDRLRESIRRKR